jgi:hypothetical protein
MRSRAETGVAIAVSVVIDAPPAAAWAELARIEDHVIWMRDATAIRFQGDQRRGVGTTFECETRVGPFRLTDVMEVTGWRPPTAMAVRHRGAVEGSGRFVLSSGPRATTTTLTWDERLRFPWWLGGAVGGWLARPVLSGVWRANLRRLRDRIASQEPAPSPDRGEPTGPTRA